MKNLSGQQFGRLEALFLVGRYRSNSIWLCKCDCGNLIKVRDCHLKSGDTKSCGCLNREKAKKHAKELKVINTKHGDASNGKKTKLYNSWCGMKDRCFNSRASNFTYYGHRGISVYKEWVENYSIFKAWALQNGYKEGLVIDRIDSNGDYEPSNCHWITASENVRKSSIARWSRRKTKELTRFMDGK